MNSIDYLNKNVKVRIDRKMGSMHPNYNSIYPVNYGYIQGTKGGDGEEIDCYVLGVFEPIDEFYGTCIAIIHRLNDNEDKLIVVPEDKFFSNEQIEALVDFQERFFKHEIIRKDIEFNSLVPELSVSDIKQSKKFYEDLGFKVMYERPEDKFCFMQFEKNQIMIQEQNNNWNVGKMEYPFGRGINISMSVSDVEGLFNKYKSMGIKFFLELEVHNYKAGNKVYNDKEFLIQDVDGYLLRFND